MDPYSDKAVLVIDMQKQIVKELDRTIRNQLLRNQQRVLQLCAELDIQVWKIELNPKYFGITVKPIRDAIRRVPRDWNYQKHMSSVFASNSGFEKQLYIRNITKIFLMGMNTDVCVLWTAQDALQLRFQVASHGSVVESINRKDHRANLNLLEESKCKLISFEEFVQL